MNKINYTMADIYKEELLTTYRVLDKLDKEVKPSLHNAVVSVKNEIANLIVKNILSKND